mgnify:CR=1 FL=1
MSMTPRRALIMAGGTGGHIFPGLAVAEALRAQGWTVHWLGSPAPSMESQFVPPRGFAYEAVQFGGVRGKGLSTLALLPLKLLRAFWQSLCVMRRVKPDVVVGLGGYITFPAGMMAVLSGKPLVLHEQNAVAGMANKVLSGVADRVFSAFPNVMSKAEWVGNPMRDGFLNQAEPAQRFADRTGPLRVLVVGGSLGAQALNTVVPQALAKIPHDQRPVVTHQSGAKQIEALRAAYDEAGVTAELTPFIDDTAQAFADADVVIVDQNEQWEVDPSKFRSKSRNTPFVGWKERSLFLTIPNSFRPWMMKRPFARPSSSAPTGRNVRSTLPLMMLARSLPVPLMAVVPVSVRFSTARASV